MNRVLILLFTHVLLAQVPAVRSPTILNPIQVPAAAQQAPVAPWVIGEVPQPGTAPNTWTLAKPVTNGVLIWWHGVLQSVGGDFTFTGNGNGGTLLTLTPAAVALGSWQDNLELVAAYQ